MDSIYRQPFRMIPPYKVISTVQILADVQDYNIKMLNIPAMWKKTKGKGIKVVVLDTGIPSHNDIALSQGKSFIDGYFEDKNGHGCVSPETLIYTNTYGIEKIEDLYERVDLPEKDWIHPSGEKSVVKEVRDSGLKTYALNEKTGKSTIADIELIHKTPVKGEVVVLHLEGGIKEKLTPWHEVCILKHDNNNVKIIRKRADELTTEDNLIFNAGEMAGYLIDNYCKLSICCGKKCSKNNCDKHIEIKEDWGYLLGLISVTDDFILDSNTNRVEIPIMNEDVLEGVMWLSRRLGFKCKINYPRSRRGKAIIESKELVLVLESLKDCIVSDPLKRRLPNIITKSPRSVIASFVAGVIDGSGCVTINNVNNSITTVSLEFAEQFAVLLNSIGISCGIYSYGESVRIKSKGEDCYNIYRCVFSSVPLDVCDFLLSERNKARARRSVEITCRSRKIESIKREDYDGNFYDFTIKDYHTYLGNGHFVSNTHVCGILGGISDNGMGIAGVSPECSLCAGAVLGVDGSGTIETIIKGIYWAVDEVGAKVINMSLGIPSGVPRLTELEKACDYAKSQGVTVVCAAGNDGSAVGQPACYDSVLAIAAVDSKMEHAQFSSFGEEIDFAAGGVNVYSTYLNNGYAKLSGTSMASPVIAGVVTLILADELKGHEKLLTPDEVYDKLKKISFDCGEAGFDSLYGHGIPIFVNGDVPNEPEEEIPEERRIPCDLSLMFPAVKSFVDSSMVYMNSATNESKEVKADRMIEAGIRGLQDFLKRIQEVRDRQK